MSARVLTFSSIAVVVVGCASLVGVGDLTLEDAAVPEGGGCGWPPELEGGVGYWAFEEQTGTTTVDCTGNGHTAVLINVDAGWWDAGFRGGAIRVANDGNRDFGCMQLQLPDSYAVPSAPFTISAFVRAEPGASNQRWIVARSSSGSNGPGWGVTMAQDASSVGLKLFNALDGGDYNLSVSGSWLDGAWHHVVVTVPTDAGATVSVDDASTTDTIVPPAIHVDQSIGVSFGCRSDGHYPLIGAIDEVRIFDHVLTPAEITSLE